MGTDQADALLKNEWLAELLADQRNLVIEYWIEDIRSENIRGYESITDEQLRRDLPPTVDSMIYAFRTGDTAGPRLHSRGVIQHRLAHGFLLPDLQMSLHSLLTAVMRVVKEADMPPDRQLDALETAETMHFLVALIAASVYEELRLEQQKRFTTAYEFGIALSRILDLSALLDLAVARVAGYLGADSVAILLENPDDRRPEARAYHQLDAGMVEVLPHMCASFECSGEGAEGVFVAADVRTSPHLGMWSVAMATHDYAAIVCAPLVAKQERLGSLALLWRSVHPVSQSEMDFLLVVAGHIANAVYNAILYEEARRKRELDILLQASKLFTSSLNTDDILGKIAGLATEAVRADLAIVFTLGSRRSGAHIAHHAANSESKSLLRRILETVRAESEATWLERLGPDFANGTPLMFGGDKAFPEHLRTYESHIGSGLVVPLRRNDILLGAFVMISLGQDAFGEGDLALSTGLADLAAVAIENAGLYEYQRNIAETLQRSFLPASLPVVAGYETAAYYRPAMAEAEIGGDFYDLFANGRSSLSVLIGDVSGKGLTAAIPTGMAKYLIRAYAEGNPSPSDVLMLFNKAFYESDPSEMFMTLFYGTVDLRQDILTYACAGHNPPLLYSSASGTIQEIEAGGLVLGIQADTVYEDRRISLEPGDVLLMYTDGATDVKNGGIRLELDGLEQLFLSSAGLPAEQIMRNLRDGISEYGQGKLADDVALVVLKRTETSP